MYQQQQAQPPTQAPDLSCLTDFSRAFDEGRLAALEEVVTHMYQGTPDQMRQANQLLNQFKGHESAWTCVDAILMKAKNVNAKFLGLQILDEAINTRWKILPSEQKEGIRGIMIQLVLQQAETLENPNPQDQVLLTKLNTTLVSIVKQEWMVNWNNFISDICGTAQQSQGKCENALNILKLLSEEVFDFGKNTIIRSQVQQFKQQMTTEFSCIFELCLFVINQAIESPQNIKPSLIRQCLKTLTAFLSWIPLGFIFETDVVERILKSFIVPSETRLEAMKFFTEVSQISLKECENPEGYKQRICLYFCMFIEQIVAVTKNRDLREEFKKLQHSKNQTNFETFCKQVCLAIMAVLRDHVTLIETMTSTATPNENIVVLRNYTQKGLEYMIQCSNIPEDELFKICIDFWGFFTFDILQKMNKLKQDSPQLKFGSSYEQIDRSGSFMHSLVYPAILKQLRSTLIDNMAKPKEVLVVIDENGDAVQEIIDDVENIYVYDSMRETLVMLTNIDNKEMDQTIQEKLDMITNNSEYFTFDRLNKLCWALGTISGCMSAEDENKFVVTVVKELLNLCEKTQGKSNKAHIASDIMYVVGQFPNFLISQWAFLKTVIKKLNEFMHEKHPGVQDMAAETFLKISKLTKHMFTKPQQGARPYVQDLIEMLPQNCKDLENHQIYMVYEGIGYMVSTAMTPMEQSALTTELLKYTNSDWKQIIALSTAGSMDFLMPTTIRSIDHILKINQRVAQSVGQPYLSYLQMIFDDLIHLYKGYSNNISTNLANNNNTQIIKPLKMLRRDILKLVQIYIEKESNFTFFNENFLPPLQEMVNDYSTSEPNARDPETLMLFATVLKKEGTQLVSYLPNIMNGLCQPTLSVISSDFTTFPEFREPFFKLVQNIINHCTQGLLNLEPQMFQTLLQTIVFAMQHQKPEVMEIGLKSMWDLNDRLGSVVEVRTPFFQRFFTYIMIETLKILTDCRHLSGFKLQVQIMQQIVKISEGDAVSQPFMLEDGTPHSLASNKVFAMQFLAENIMKMFPNLNQQQVEAFVLSLYNNSGEWKQFKGGMRDMMIQMRQFASQENDFYVHELKREEDKQKKREQEKKDMVPGMKNNNNLSNNGSGFYSP